MLIRETESSKSHARYWFHFFLFSTNAKWVILTHTEHNGETAGAEECATH